jgi:hypothetical protein
MKKTIFCFICLVFFGSASHSVSAGEYRCDITSTKSVDCGEYVDVKHSCNFPDELNVLRTEQSKTNEFTYPEFCTTTCAEQSGIPKHCRTGRIATAQVIAVDDVLDVPASGVHVEGEEDERTILGNAYGGVKIVFTRFWDWLIVAVAGEDFELKSMSTPVAGVRG